MSSVPSSRYVHEAYDTLFSAFFSTPTTVLSSEYTIEDPFAQDLSVRCGVFPPQGSLDISYERNGGKCYSDNHM